MQSTILQIGPFKDANSTLSALAKASGVGVVAVSDIESAISTLCSRKIDMVFFDTSLNLGMFFVELEEARVNVPVVACGPATPVQNAVKAIRLGAIEYLSIPLDEALITPLLEKIKPTDTSGVIAGDPKTLDLLEQAKRFASSNATILLRGESGTGKEVFSKFIHSHSTRKSENFVAVNCAAIPENLLESELFGHEKGAFSGALSKRVGKFEQANKGTLLLDEISEMDVLLQAKLLRAIQEKVIDPVGSASPTPVDIRMIATTNRKLEDYVAEGKFREDLYFRLNVVMLEIPPLRERVGDIIPLAQFFAKTYGEQNGFESINITPEAQSKLNGCYWKGNVRELENTIHRAVLMMSTGEVDMKPEHIVLSPMSLKMMTDEVASEQENKVAQHSVSPAANMAAARYASAGGGFKAGTGASKHVSQSNNMVGKSLADIEREMIVSTLDYCQGNRTHAADILGISIRTLRNKLSEYEAG